ncbi:PilN domain-containing protein [Neisseria weaveri]|uniref:PilN n=1 Tax=Neisseria weaveri TaxID=28091 RepID=A0A3S4Z743_9NEIS|nr:PilN domain-containing protein [Neisseria weaveri]EGV35349.1 type IV pilus assembly protein PilN [Neisseria weaveri LMG 5135]EGV35883.1 type IV pilus assembly protein PilN [Neisseria weaveri ATCC 51223]SAY51233.1 PilN [Neisseria weaveri]VEJ49944.1 PilN [Neisseria weaveri]
MIELIKINLLPYREEIKNKQKQKFKLMILAALAGGLVVSTFIYFAINQTIRSQENRNTFLSNEINRIDKKLEEIKKLKEEKEIFISRKKKVEELQEKRFQAAYILDTLNVLIPEGTYLTAINAEDANTYIITGHALSDNRIAMFMRSIPSTGIFQQPELLSIKKVENIQEFTLKITLNFKNNSNEVMHDDQGK